SQKTDWLRPKTEPTCFTVRALITFEACRRTKDLSVRRHQAPTLIGCLFVKELAHPALPSAFFAAASLRISLQRRSESM
ncbi:hypothetical protein, partial [Cupriavidus plantarum]|uniref:hypothetical protein n=1 Tax=Cupriavidus plantarum TaxID=942865 RepID=UPI001C638E97